MILQVVHVFGKESFCFQVWASQQKRPRLHSPIQWTPGGGRQGGHFQQRVDWALQLEFCSVLFFNGTKHLFNGCFWFP